MAPELTFCEDCVNLQLTMAERTHHVLLEQISGLPKSNGFRFNAYLWTEIAGELFIDLYVKGFRVYGGKIHLPSFAARSTHPNIYLPPAWAEVLARTVLEDTTLRDSFPGAFPLLRANVLAKALEFPKEQLLQDFPRLAEARGFLSD